MLVTKREAKLFVYYHKNITTISALFLAILTKPTFYGIIISRNFTQNSYLEVMYLPYVKMGRII